MIVRANNNRTSGAVRAMYNDPVPDPDNYSPPSRISPSEWDSPHTPLHHVQSVCC